jgi:DtxR family Mn-dependent transcriptional regulator
MIRGTGSSRPTSSAASCSAPSLPFCSPPCCCRILGSLTVDPIASVDHVKRSSEPTERYLQSVLEIAEDSGRATRAKIARRRHMHPVTIAETTDRLQQAGLIYLLSGRRIHLTVPGTARALAIVRKHRVIECFLDQVVGLEWALVHRAAARWQHVVGDDVEARMARLLGRPRTSPYGSAVPGIDESSAR